LCLQLVATACLYLASKVQETPKYLRDVIKHAERKKWAKWDREHPAERGRWEMQVRRISNSSTCDAGGLWAGARASQQFVLQYKQRRSQVSCVSAVCDAATQVAQGMLPVRQVVRQQVQLQVLVSSWSAVDASQQVNTLSASSRNLARQQCTGFCAVFTHSCNTRSCNTPISIALNIQQLLCPACMLAFLLCRAAKP
jgi:hypothetical protein